jgi:hypothetical protein
MIGGGWRGAHVVHGAHLLDLQIYAGSFETCQHGEMVGDFFQGRCLLGLGPAWQGICKLSVG